MPIKPRQHRSWSGRALTFLLLTVAFFLQAAELSQETREQIIVLCRYTAPIAGETTSLLAAAGYTPPPAEADPDAYPAIRQIEAAYHAAEYHKKGQGDQLLAMLARQLHERYESVVWSDPIKKIVALPPPPDEGPLVFARPPPGPRPKLPPETAALIREIAAYSESGMFGDTHSLLKEYCHLSDHDADEILATSTNHTDAMLRGYGTLDVAGQKDSLRREYENIAKRVESIAYAPIFASFRGDPLGPPGPTGPRDHPPNPPPSDGPPSRPGDHPSNGGGGGGDDGGGFKPRPAPHRPDVHPPPPGRMAEVYRELVTNSYHTAEARSFAGMIGVTEGFGGVIFGSPVTPPPGNLKVKSFTFQADAKDASYGRLLFALSDGRTAAFEQVRSESVGCAVRLLYQSFSDGVKPPNPGEGIGLAGIKDFVPSVAWDAAGKPHVGQKQNAVLHPALENTNLGWALLGVDSLPIIPEYLVAQARADSDEPGSTLLARFWATFQDAGTWKVTDQPATIAIVAPTGKGMDSAVVLSRTQPGPGADQLFLGMATDFSRESSGPLADLLKEGLPTAQDEAEISRLRSLLEKREHEDAQAAKRRGEAFEQVLPILVRHCPDYDLAEEFARILSVLRWARQTGAPAPDLSGKSLHRVTTPAAFLLNPEKGLIPVEVINFNPSKPEAAYLEELPVFRKAAQVLLGSNFSKFEDALDEALAANRELEKIEDQTGRSSVDKAKVNGIEEHIEELFASLGSLTAQLTPDDQSLVEKYCTLKAQAFKKDLKK